MDSSLLAAPGVLLFICCCLPAFQIAVRARCLKELRRTVHAQLPWVSWVQSCRNPLLTTLVGIGAYSVTVEFFLLFLPTLMWTGHHDLSLQLTLVLTLATFVNSALKDILCSPRPTSLSSTGQLKETAYTLDASVDEVEYGAPSLHVCLTICMTGLTVTHVLSNPSALTPAPHVLFALGAAWVAWVAWGRLYLGVHSPIDLALGALVGSAILLTALHLGPTYTDWITSSPHSCAINLLAFLAMLRLYPQPEDYTTSYLYATTFLGAWFGFFRFYKTTPFSPDMLCPLLPAALHPLAHPASLLAVKLLTGYTAALAAKEAAKKVASVVISKVFDVAPGPLCRLLKTPLLPYPGNPVAPAQQQDVKVYTRFCSYAAVTFVISTHERLFQGLGQCFS